MVVTLASVVLAAALVYVSAPWWGAPASPSDRRIASLVTFMAGAGGGLVFRPDPWPAVFLPALMAIVGVVDVRHRIIPNRLVAATGVWALWARFYEGHWTSALIAGLAVFLFYFMVHVLTHGGLGMGDVKFSGVLAFALGYPAGVVSVVSGMWAAGIYAAYLLVVRRERRTQFMALGPFLAVGGIVGLLDMLH